MRTEVFTRPLGCVLCIIQSGARPAGQQPDITQGHRATSVAAAPARNPPTRAGGAGLRGATNDAPAGRPCARTRSPAAAAGSQSSKKKSPGAGRSIRRTCAHGLGKAGSVTRTSLDHRATGVPSIESATRVPGHPRGRPERFFVWVSWCMSVARPCAAGFISLSLPNHHHQGRRPVKGAHPRQRRKLLLVLAWCVLMAFGRCKRQSRTD